VTEGSKASGADFETAIIEVTGGVKDFFDPI
jgi:hypothetical protein